MYRNATILSALLSLTAACGADHMAADAGHGATDAGHVATDAADGSAMADAPAPGDGAVIDASSDGAAGPPVLHECAAMDYMDVSGGDDAARVVRPRGTTGYTPRCLTIRAGQSVTFEMNFATHPLVAGIAHGPTEGATSPSPIAPRSMGMTYTVAFPSAGYFPFYCEMHRHIGMVGVVRVVP